MKISTDQIFKRCWSVLRAPHAGRGQPEQLALCVGQRGQHRLLTQLQVLLIKLRVHEVALHLLHPGEVGPQRLLDAAVVRDVLALGVDTVEVHGGTAPEVHAVVAVLVDDALRLLQILPLGLRLPPVHQVTLRVLLAALGVEVSTKLRECFRNKVIMWVF